ncbi:surface lipoprotein assembly modifier, partial [Streptococcus pneumoniae]|uniref:surface lipoprotein assembly modifier n=1 Tax=Streptococcus pneumoniae TaxID=1313 RepID=UPI001EF7A738
MIYYPNATRYYLLGADFYDEKVPQDPSDSYERRGIRTAWGQEWAGGLSSRAQISINKRHY